MDPSNPTLTIPAGMTEEEVLAVVLRYAPLVRFEASEVHFPADPSLVAARSRFRACRAGRKDEGWNSSLKKWVRGDFHDPPYCGELWPIITLEMLKSYSNSGHFDPTIEDNLRPWDTNNLHRRDQLGSREGLFLQRVKSLRRERSGNPPSTFHQIHAPVLLDLWGHQGWIYVLYWFFYELNQWKFLLTHEGDWEHITWLFEEEDFRRGRHPEWAYFAQHKRGLIVPFADLQRETETHPTIFVDRDGHPSRPGQRNSEFFLYSWQTWEGPHEWVARAGWRDFAGAWGEIGEFSDTTGPLGPYFKRHRDRVTLRFEKGRWVVVIPG